MSLSSFIVLFIFGYFIGQSQGTTFLSDITKPNGTSLDILKQQYTEEKDYEIKLQQNVSSLAQKISFMIDNLNNQSDVIQALESLLASTNSATDNQEKISRMEDQVKNCNAAVQQLEQSVATSLWLSREAIQREHEVVAFTVGLSTNKQHNSSNIVVFDHIYLNQGTTYDSSKGIFTAPVSGTYSFSLTLVVSKNDGHFSLLIDNVERYSFNAILTNNHGQTSATVTYHLNRGDKVWIASTDRFSGSVIESQGASIFTGHLLHVDHLISQ